jgi:hypothetical protein
LEQVKAFSAPRQIRIKINPHRRLAPLQPLVQAHLRTWVQTQPTVPSSAVLAPVLGQETRQASVEPPLELLEASLEQVGARLVVVVVVVVMVGTQVQLLELEPVLVRLVHSAVVDRSEVCTRLTPCSWNCLI